MLAENMVGRMIKNSSESGGKYISVHLRFEEVRSLFFHFSKDRFLSSVFYASLFILVSFYFTLCVMLFPSQDMVAFSCCIYDGGEEEKREMDIARERGWRGKFNKRGRIIKPGAIRMDGKCPLTPLEVNRFFSSIEHLFLFPSLHLFYGVSWNTFSSFTSDLRHIALSLNLAISSCLCNSLNC